MTQTSNIASSGLTGAAIATLIGIGGVFAPTAQANPLQLFDDSTTDPGGTIETLVPRSPGVYGFEARGGYASNPARTWEVGVGTHTSQPGNFAEGHIDWLDDTGVATLYDFSLNWKPGSNVTATVGDTVVSYDADWEVGNAIKFLVKRNAYFWLDTVDGVAFDYEVDQLTANKGNWTNFAVTGDSLLDGWSLAGKIGLTPHEKGSFNEVTIKPGMFTPDEEETAVVPEPATILGLLGVLGVATQLRKR